MFPFLEAASTTAPHTPQDAKDTPLSQLQMHWEVGQDWAPQDLEAKGLC